MITVPGTTHNMYRGSGYEPTLAALLRWLSASNRMNTVVAVLLDGMVFSSYLFLVSVGLTIIFGVMKVLNLAHGASTPGGATPRPT